MSLARLVVHLQANYKSLTAGLGIARNDVAKTVAHIASSAAALEAMKGKVSEVSAEYEALVAATAEFANSTDLAGDAADFLRIKLRYIEDTMKRLNGQTERFEQQLTSAVASFQLRLLTDALRKQQTTTEQIRRLWQGNQNALIKYNAHAQRTAQIHGQINQPQPMQQSTSRAMIKYQGGGEQKGSALQVAGIILQAKAASSMSAAMTKARSAVATVSTAIREVAAATNTSVSVMDRFRVGLMAPKVNPSLNTLPGLIQNIATKAAGAVENFRGFGDATIAGIPAILASITSGMGKVMGAGDSLQATVSKLVSEFDIKKQALDRVAKIYPTAGTAVDLFKQAMDVVAPAAEKVAQKVDLANDAVRQGTIWTRNFAYLATGSFQKTGTSADAYSRGVYHALQPTRLMVFESKFVEAGMTKMRRVITAVTHPLHVLAMAYDRNRGEISELRANLPPLTGGLQLGTRAFRAFAHATYFSSEVLRGIRTAATPVTWLAGKLWGLVSPAKAAKAGLDGVATGGKQAGAALRLVTATASTTVTALRKVATTGNAAFSGMMQKTSMLRTAVAALAFGLVAMGTKTAIATEKSNAVFGTMLHDMAQGKALVKSIQGTEAAKLFDNQELLDSSRLLFKAGVSTTALAGKTDQFAKIAAATSTDIGDLARIYQQGANAGSFGQDKINQFAERGIAIYEGLAHATGVSGSALQKMISDGKIGVAQMDAAFAHLTEGTGYYANALTDLGQTTAGKLGAIKNNVNQALGNVMGMALEVLAPFGTAMVSMSEGIKSSFESVKGPVMYAATAAAWFFKNLGSIAEFAWVTMKLNAAIAFNDLAYWFTEKLPAYLTWFKNNWANIFLDIASGTMAVFSNLVTNIKNAMGQIWDYIKSGGRSGLQFTWTPLLDGFKSTVEQLPDIPDRAMTELERSLASQAEGLGTNLANDFDASFKQAIDQTAQPTPELKEASTAPVVQGGDKAQEKIKENQKIAENKAVQVASLEGQSVVAGLLKGLKQNDDKAAKAAAINSEKHLEKLARDSDRAPRLIVQEALT